MIKKFFGIKPKLPSGQKCARNQPVYEPITRIPKQLRQSSSQFYRLNKNVVLSKTANLLVEICDLINKLERRIYCFMTELERTKTYNGKYKSLLELYNSLTPDLSGIMEIYSYLLDGKLEGDDFVMNIYLKLLTYLRNIGKNLLVYLNQNMQNINYRYTYQSNTSVPKCYSKPYSQVSNMVMKGARNDQINQVKYNLISSCISKQDIQGQCVDLYDPILAGGSRDVLIMQAFMRIELLVSTIKKEREKQQSAVQSAIKQRIQKQESQINRQVFDQLKKLTRGAYELPRQTVVLKNRQCAAQQQYKERKGNDV